jgi:nicotinate phosphoribosyltransferase
VEASAIAAQIVETYLLSVVNYQTLVATKAARIVEAAGGARVYDFGTRRAHGPHAGILAARASWIGGCAGTSNVWAARALGIPPVGTMAHAWVMAFEREEEAFERFVEIYPQGAVLLLDTYDTLAAARLAVRWADRIAGVRLDSGDLAALARQVRAILDAAGAGRVRIVATGDLNEYKIAALRAAGAPIDAFGVGTDLVTSRDVPALGGVYKMVERAGPAGPVGVVKESSGKRTWPGRKQVYRAESGDLLCLADEPPRGRPLLEPVMQAGRRTQAPQSLTRIRERARAEREALPPEVRRITAPAAWPVRMSERLEDARRSAARRISQEAGDR